MGGVPVLVSDSRTREVDSRFAEDHETFRNELASVARDGRRRWWVAYAAVTIALLYTHYFALIPIAIQQGVFAIAAWKRARAGHPVRGLVTGIWLTWLALVAAAAPSTASRSSSSRSSRSF